MLAYEVCETKLGTENLSGLRTTELCEMSCTGVIWGGGGEGERDTELQTYTQTYPHPQEPETAVMLHCNGGSQG